MSEWAPAVFSDRRMDMCLIVDGRRLRVLLGYITASHEVASKLRPVGYLYGELPNGPLDSGWRVFAGDETQEYADDPSNFSLYNASTIVEIDPSISSLLSATAPVTFMRSRNGRFQRVVD